MHLMRLRLQNIRSYVDETIIFPKGSTLLSGDIGSGKSTCLLAIEFALFGSSQSELSSESLLRKGRTLGSVELEFELEGKEVIIYRGLKKDSNGIKQTNGHIIINGSKKELTPTELKAEIIHLLGYPKEFITKKKNHVFRYTVYCPQEAMKLILQEPKEMRLDSLRKIFNIDKYKTIRDNLQNYLKKSREKIAILETKIEPIVMLENQIKEAKEKIEELKVKNKIIGKDLLEIEDKVKIVKSELEEEEEFLKKFNKFKQEKENLGKLLKQTREILSEIVKKEDNLSKQQSEILVQGTLDEINAEIKNLDEQKINFLNQKTVLERNIGHCQEKIGRIQTEIETGKNLKNNLEKYQQEYIEAKNKIVQKETIIKELKEINVKEKEIDLKLIEHRHKLNSVDSLLKQIITLNDCPTCKQNVSLEYKEKFSEKEKEKLAKSEFQMQNLEQEQMIVFEIRKQLENKLNEIIEEEKKAEKLEVIVRETKFKVEKLNSLKKEITNVVKENNQLIQRMDFILKDEQITFPRIIKRIEQLSNIKQKIVLKENIKNQLLSLNNEKGLMEKRLNRHNEELDKNSLTLKGLFDNSELVEAKKKLLSELVLKEKEVLQKNTAIKTSLRFCENDLTKLEIEFEKLQELKIKLKRKKETYNWLNDYFLNLTYTIEKELLLQIYHQFNELFTEWFDILVEDTELSARLDDSFTPIIEQNGHEISFPNLSGGEKTAVSLAYRLALNKVTGEVVNSIKTKDLLVLDEPTDGFSTQQLDKVRDVLDRLNLKQVIIVSHESKIESFVNSIIKISKFEHISKVSS
jgi:DNA repair protein SbcC/Rad50